MEPLVGDLRHIVEQCHTRKRGAVADILWCMEQNPKMLVDLQKSLGDMGFRQFEYLGAGIHAVGLHTTEGQVVRLSREMMDVSERPLHPAILQPIMTRRIKAGGESVLLEVLPRVRTEGVTDAQQQMVYKALQKSGWHVGDVEKKGNVGIMELGGREVPVLVDAGRVEVFLDKKVDNDEHLKPWLDDKGQWLQKAFDPRTAVSGVVDRAGLNHVERALRGKKSMGDHVASLRQWKDVDTRRQSQTVAAIREDGMYPEQLAQLYERAAAKFEDSIGGPNFSEVLKAERALMRDEQKSR